MDRLVVESCGVPRSEPLRVRGQLVSLAPGDGPRADVRFLAFAGSYGAGVVHAGAELGNNSPGLCCDWKAACARPRQWVACCALVGRCGGSGVPDAVMALSPKRGNEGEGEEEDEEVLLARPESPACGVTGTKKSS